MTANDGPRLPFQNKRMPRIMLLLSLLLNIAVLIPVCGSMLVDTYGSGSEWVRECYGPDSPGRRILLAVYLSIGLVSAGLLVWRQPMAIAALLAVQIVYKVLTPITVGTLHNPVVISNLLIAAFHTAAITILWRHGFFDRA
jgi:hypothetical protein